jgi:hypothetical protein
MNIEIHQPKLEAMIQRRLASGRFRSVEEVLMQALESAPMPEEEEKTRRTGADLVAAMQAMPYKDVDIEPARPHQPARDVEF